MQILEHILLRKIFVLGRNGGNRVKYTYLSVLHTTQTTVRDEGKIFVEDRLLLVDFKVYILRYDTQNTTGCLNPSMTMGFKFQLLARIERVLGS